MFKAKKPTTEPDSMEKAYEYAVFLLSLRLRTEGEVKEKMKGRGYNQNVIDNIVGQLKEQKYLDDQRYAEVFLDNLKKYKNFGFYGIKKKFMEKKLPSSIIESVLALGLTVEDEIKIAERFLKKNELKIENKEDKQKAAQRLRSRGFRGEVIAQLLF